MKLFTVPRHQFSRLSREDVRDFIEDITNSLYPSRCGRFHRVFSQQLLKRRLIRLLKPVESRLSLSIEMISANFFAELPAIKADLDADARAIADNDPAASGAAEVVLAYPGFFAIMVYRMAHKLHGLEVPLIPRMMTEQAHSLTGIDIHPGAVIGKSFFIDHGTGIVVGETAIIGNNVKLYQGVTVGALNVSKGQATQKRHPTIEDNVIIYAGSTILGGKTTIGHDSIIGGNVWLTESVPPYSMVYHKSEVRIRERLVVNGVRFTDVIDFSI